MARVGTWNLENLFSFGEEGGPASAGAYEAKVAAVARTIAGLDVDVLALQEVGTPAALDDVAARLGPRWRHVLAAPDRRGIRVGVLARHDLLRAEEFPRYAAGLPDVVVDDLGHTTRDLARPGLQVTVVLDGVEVTVVSCHFKATPQQSPGGRAEPADEDERARASVYALARRAAEAATTRILANQLLAGEGRRRALVVAGDLNDVAGAATTRILQGPRGGQLGGEDFGEPDDGDGWRLWNLGRAIAEEPGRRGLIDHLLVSHALLAGLGAVIVHDVVDVPGEDGPVPCSDHRPVVAELALRPGR